ncbi:MAG: pyocin knob domain-containing protein [Lachnospiraceae bacterium]|nr:pyocin knob domain-containing protein [Lachnospiraceae bacterium]
MSKPDRINLNVLIEKTSLNSPERTGVYYVTGNNIGALPSGFSNYGILLCMRSPYSLHPTNSNCVYVQEYTDVYGKHASRSFNNGAWTNWVTTATKDDLLSIDIKKYASGALSKGSQKEINLTFEPRTGYTRRYFVGELFGTGSNSVIVNVHGSTLSFFAINADADITATILCIYTKD